MEKIAIKNKNYFSKGNLMNDNELCVNLWFCFDKETGFINAISGQGYFLTDSDEQKSILLKELATSDFLNAQWLPIPNRYKTNIIDVDRNKSMSFSGVIHTSDIDILGMGLFEDVFKQIEAVNQDYIPVKDAAIVRVPDAPLYVMTAIENTNGRLRPVC